MNPYAEHASRAKVAAKANGAHDCIHYAPEHQRRADALYRIANEEFERSGLKWWEGRLPNGSLSGQPYLLADGRMVVCATVWFVEARAP